MAVVEKSALVPYSSMQMYTLVNDVPGYQDFLPWCGGSRYLSQQSGENVGEVDIVIKGVSQSFATRNRLVPGESIEMSLVSGPFRQLHGVWRFHSLSEAACKISLRVEFEFSSRIVEMTTGPIFRQITASMVDAFVERARQEYGNG